MFKQMSKRKITIGIILLVIICGGYFAYKKIIGNDNAVQYVTTTVKKGALIVSISGSGQVSVSEQIDIKPKVSGEIVSLAVEQGQEIKKGTIIAKLDSSDAQKAVNDAETSLETVNLQLEELISPPDELTLFQAENALTQAKDSLTKLKFTQEANYQKALQAKQKAIDNITKGYEDSFNTIETVFFNVPTIMTDLREILYEDTINENQLNTGSYRLYSDEDQILPFIVSAENDYTVAEAKYTPNLASYKNTSRYASSSDIAVLLTRTLETTKAIAQAIKSEKNVIDYTLDYISQKKWRSPSVIVTYQSDLKTYLTQVNTYYSNLLTCQQTIENNQDALINAEQDIIEMDQNYPLDLTTAQKNVEEKEKKLADLKAGPDDLDLRGQKITIQQKEDALASARENLADYFVKAPFDGIVAEVNIKKGDSVSSGTTLATLITKQKIAQITLNEIDAAKVKVDQKATISFDALPDLNITGRVIKVDTMGTVTQGVVSYGVKIAFDADMETVKPGMSLTADIITEAKQEVLLLPNSAVKSQGNFYYVELVELPEEMKEQLSTNVSGTVLPTPPKSQAVEIGLSNDVSIEIVSGLKEGDIVVTSTVSQTTQTQNSSQTQGFMIPGMGSGTGSRDQVRAFR